LVVKYFDMVVHPKQIRKLVAPIALLPLLLAGSIAFARANEAEVLARIPTGPQSRPCSVAFAAGSAWASLYGTNEVVRVDPATNTVIARIAVDGQPCGITSAAGAVWVGNFSGASVARINPRTNRVVRRFRLFQVYDVLAGHGSVWATSPDGTVLRINPKRNRVIKRFHLSTGAGGLAVTRNAVWVGLIQRPVLVKIDPKRNKVVRRIRTGSAASVWLTGTPTAVWASDTQGNTVVRIDRRTNRRVETITVGRGPADGGVVAGDVWVPNLQDNTLSRIDAQTNTVIETVGVGPGPFVVPNHPSELWVGSWAGGEVWRLAPR